MRGSMVKCLARRKYMWRRHCIRDTIQPILMQAAHKRSASACLLSCYQLHSYTAIEGHCQKKAQCDSVSGGRTEKDTLSLLSDGCIDPACRAASDGLRCQNAPFPRNAAVTT